jgi:hypothetical protein
MENFVIANYVCRGERMKFKIPFFVVWAIFFVLMFMFIPVNWAEATEPTSNLGFHIIPHLILGFGFAVPVYLVINENYMRTKRLEKE